MNNEIKYPLGGYAPGNYYCTCATCKDKYQGDKRSFQCKPCGTKSQAEWDTMTDDQKKERVKRNMEIWDEHQKTTALSNKETEESATRLEAIYDQIEKEASEAALMWPWGYSQKDYEDGKPRPAMVVNADRKEYYKKGAIPYGEKLHEAQEILREVFQKHESGLLPDRFVYDKIKRFFYDGE